MLFYFLVIQVRMGDNPPDASLTSIEKSEQYNKSIRQFENTNPAPLSTGRSTLSIMQEFFFSEKNRKPVSKLPEALPPLSALQDKSQSIRFMWLVHSTILLEIDSTRILVDPMLSDYASPIPGLIKRFQPAPISINEIKDVDIILISHDHYDHLDYETISQVKNRDIQFVVPLGVGAHLEYWGIDAAKIQELDWWQSFPFQKIVLTCTPSQHFSGRGFGGNKTLWASWAIQGQQQNIFFSGDSGYSEHYKNIGDRLGPFDITFLENGAYSDDWKFIHQLPEEAVQAHLDLKGQWLVPIHWGMFDLAFHTWDEPIIRLTHEAEKKGVKVIAPKLGELISTGEYHFQETWWEALNK